MNIVKLGLFVIVCLGQCHEMIFAQRMKFTSRITSHNFSWKAIKYFRCCMLYASLSSLDDLRDLPGL